MIAYRIYGLFVRDACGAKRYFYVGRTERSIEARVAEHRNGSRHRHEDLYVYLRCLKAQATEWESEELYHCKPGEYALDAEHWYVVQLLDAGHDLRNMRYGDRRNKLFLERIKNNPAIRSVRDVTRARLDQATSKSGQVRAHGRLLRKQFEMMLERRGVPDIKNCPLFPKALANRLALQGISKIGPGLNLQQIVRLARDMRGWRRLQQMARNVEANHPLLTRHAIDASVTKSR